MFGQSFKEASQHVIWDVWAKFQGSKSARQAGRLLPWHYLLLGSRLCGAHGMELLGQRREAGRGSASLVATVWPWFAAVQPRPTCSPRHDRVYSFVIGAGP